MNNLSKSALKFHVSPLEASRTFKEVRSLTFIFLILKSQISRYYLIRRSSLMTIFHFRVKRGNVEYIILGLGWGEGGPR